MDSQQEEQIRAVTLTSQLIVTALVLGLLGFACLAIYMGMDAGNEDEENQYITTMIAAAFTAVAFFAASLVPRFVRKSMRQTILGNGRFNNNISAQRAVEMGPVKLLTISYLTSTIAGMAILESAAFMNLVAYLFEQQLLSLLCAALLIVTILSKFPTRSSVENWIRTELKTIDDLRSLDD